MIRTLATYALLAAALALHLHGLLPHFPNDDYNFDAIHVYLPLAKRLLAEGSAFFLAEESIQAPPLSYAWPALLGADLQRVKVANVALSCALLLLVFRSATLWHSRLAGIAAALAFAASPLLKPFLATAMTEPPFLFLLGTWIWALSEWRVRERPVYLAFAAVALGLALLTRASLFYGLVVFVAVLAWLYWRRVPRAREAFLAHVVALAFPAAFMVKNLLVFSFPFYATGAGNALYLGTSPIFGGYDPWYIGLVYDVGAITGDQSHLTLDAEAKLGGAARILLHTLEPGYIAEMYARKLAAFLFVTNAEYSGDVLWLRSWRIVTLVLSLVGVAAIRDRMLRWIVAGLLVYQVAVHIPVLYSHRYSVGALDVWLATLSGVGLASLWERRRPVEGFAIAATLLVGLLAGAQVLWKGSMPEPDVFGAAHVLVWERRDEAVRFDGRHALLDLDVHDAPNFSPWFNHVLVIDSTLSRSGRDEACGTLRAWYRRDGEKDFPEPPLVRRLEADGQRHLHQYGVQLPLRLSVEGRLRLDVECAPGGSWQIHRVAVYSARGALDLKERLLRRRD